MLSKIIAGAKLLLQEAQHRLSNESIAVIEKVYSDVTKLDNFIKKKIAEIEKDNSLDPFDKRDARRKLFEHAQRKLEALKAKRNYATMIEKIELKLDDRTGTVRAEKEKKEEAILKFLREREIRDRLAGLTEAQILSHFGDSLFDGSNDLVLDAILNAPPGFEILSEDVLSNLRIVRAKKISPEMAHQIDTVQDFKSKTMHIFTLIKEELDNLRIKELPEAVINKASAE